MNEAEFAQIEKELGIILPTAYRQVMSSSGVELQQLVLEYLGKCNHFNFAQLYFDVGWIIGENLEQRGEDSATGYAFPEWEKTFFLIGDNTGGDYYCIRLDNTDGVYVVGSDCGDEASRASDSLAAYVQDQMSGTRSDMGDPELAVAVPFLTEREWEKLRQTDSDPGLLGTDYEAWSETSSNLYDDHRDADRNPRRIWMESDAFLAWCRDQKRAPHATAMNVYAEDQLETKEPWLRKYRRQKSK